MTDRDIDEPQEPPMDGEEQADDMISSRRLLYILMGVLAAAAIALLVLIVWLLRPEPVVEEAAVADGCPMEVTRSIYGYGIEPGELLVKPLGVAVDDDGNVWVADTGNARVVQFDSGGGLVRIIGDGDDPGRLSSPYGLSFSADGQRLYIADWTRREVVVYTTDGRYIESLPAAEQDLEVFGPDGFSPYDVHVRGAEIVVSSNDGLYFFDRSGMVVDRWGGETRGSGVGEFAFPDAFAIDPTSGDFYVADTLNRRVVALDDEGNVLWISGQPDQDGQIVGFWQLPRSVVVGQDGMIYVTDTFRAQNDCAGTGHIVVLDPTGALVGEFGAAGRTEGTFSFPEKMAVAADGSFAIADRENNRAALFTVGPMPPADSLEQSTYEQSFARISP